VAAGAAANVPVTVAPVPPFDKTSVFPLLVSETVVVFDATPEAVPVMVAPVPFGVMVKVLPSLSIENVLELNGYVENVPVADEPVPPLDRVRVFEPLVRVTWVPLNGIPEAVPTMLAPVALVLRLRVFVPFVTVIGLLVERGTLENVPVWVAATGELAVRVTLSTVMVEIELLPLALLVPTVPVPPAGTAPMSMLQSRFIFAFPELPGLGPCTCGKESCNRPPAAC